MLSENILWARAINPASGRLMREPTILGVVLIAAGLFAAFTALVFLGSFL
jgi:type IV secretory pathway VirB3-like protein